MSFVTIGIIFLVISILLFIIQFYLDKKNYFFIILFFICGLLCVAKNKLLSNENKPEITPISYLESPIIISKDSINFDSLNCIRDVKPDEKGRPYIIRGYDRLWDLARKEYGKGFSYFWIFIKDFTDKKASKDPNYEYVVVNDLKAGQKIYIPSKEEILQELSESIIIKGIEWKEGGTISIKGSSTLFPITKQISECFIKEGLEHTNEDYVFSIQSTGTVKGFENFCSDSTQIDILNASDEMSISEFRRCRDNTINYLNFLVGKDEIAVVANKENKLPLNELSEEELKSLFFSGTSWNDIREGFPEEKILRCYPTPQSGTFRFIAKKLFGMSEKEFFHEFEKIPNLSFARNDSEIAKTISSYKFGFSFLSASNYIKSDSTLNLIPIFGQFPLKTEGERDIIKPYLLVRNLFIYVPEDRLRTNSHLKQFINFYLTNVRFVSLERGYLPLSNSEQEEQIEKLYSVVYE